MRYFLWALVFCASLGGELAWANCITVGCTTYGDPDSHPDANACTVPRQNRMSALGKLVTKCNEACAEIQFQYLNEKGEVVATEDPAAFCLERDFDAIRERRKAYATARRVEIDRSTKEGRDLSRLVGKCTSKLSSVASFIKRCEPFN